VADEGLLGLAHDLARRGKPFALATVVRCERPTSAKPGARALIREGGAITGWIGGSCAEPLVVKEALDALQDGQPRLLSLVGQGATTRLGSREGVREYSMSCHSGGTLEIYVEPVLPRPELVAVGSGPVVETLTRLAAAAGFRTTVVDREARGVGRPRTEGCDEEARAQPVADRQVDDLDRVTLTPQTAVVIATHGRFDEEALERALGSEASYVSLVASPKRAQAVRELLHTRGVPEERLRRLKAPAGIDLGAITPAEIAVSILAEVVQWRRRPGPAAPLRGRPSAEVPIEARDPVCGMTVAVATASHRRDTADGPVYFCLAGCQQAYDRDPSRYSIAEPT